MIDSRPDKSAPLVIAAHGSSDSAFAVIVADIANRVRALRPSLDVHVGFLDHGPPHLADALADGCIVVPLFLASGYHVGVDLPEQAPGARITAAIGPDERLAEAVADRLAQAGYAGHSPVVLAAAGSTDERAQADVQVAAALLADRLDAEVTAAFLATGQPRVEELSPGERGPRVVAPYLIAPGAFFDLLRVMQIDVLASPIGDHPAVAETILARYERVSQP